MMESKTLETIQTAVKVAKIVCTVAFVCGLVGGILCLVGIACAGLPGSLKLGGVTIHSIVDNASEVSPGTLYSSMAAGAIMCAASCVVCKLADRYCRRELEAGTPFTLEGAQELLRLGICTICVPLGGIVVAGICSAVVSNYFAGAPNLNIDGSGFVAFGVALLFASLLCKYGAELAGKD